MMISINFLLLILVALPVRAELIRRQNAFLNITSSSDKRSQQQQNLLLFDSVLYGFNSPQYTVYGQLVKVISFNTSSMQVNNYGCARYLNENLPQKYVALVSRGGCSFEHKIKIAYESQASAIIVYNTENSAFIMFSNSKPF